MFKEKKFLSKSKKIITKVFSLMQIFALNNRLYFKPIIYLVEFYKSVTI